MLNFTLIKLSLFFIVGILLGFYFEFVPMKLLPWGVAITLIFGISYFRARKNFHKDVFFGISSYLIFLFIGIFTASINLPENQPDHYINKISDFTSEKILIAKVSEKLKPGAYQEKFIAEAIRLGDKNVHGKILLNVTSDSLTHNFQIGDVIAIPAELAPINPPLNPFQFDYARYMKNLGVLRQANLSSPQILKLKSGKLSLHQMAGAVRGKIIEKLRKSELSHEELAIIQALLLGQRQDISKEVYEYYAAAGVIHILAVSGLHVGIILLILSRFLQPLERWKYGKFIKTLLLLVLLWSFAVIAGLSPSITRAVTMFSFVAVGMQLNRQTNILNTLFMSLLFLLLINPLFIHQVGFQLSYAAVFSIVLIQPHLYRLFETENGIIKYFWGILTVTIAAQAGVLPLSLFYFHQFPGLFFVSNLVILPFLGLILGIGLLISILAVVDLLPHFLGEAYGGMISVLNNFVEWIASKENFLFQDIYFSLFLCLAFYLLIIGLILLLRNFQFRRLALVLAAIIVVQLTYFYEETRWSNKEAVIFHKSRNTLLGIRSGKNLQLFHNLDSSSTAPAFLTNYKTGSNIQSTLNFPLKYVYIFEGKKILRIDSSGIYNIPGFNPNVLLLTGSPRMNLERVIHQLKPHLIIADGSNYPSLIARWKKTALKEKLPFHATGEKGAYIINSSDKIPEIN